MNPVVHRFTVAIILLALLIPSYSTILPVQAQEQPLLKWSHAGEGIMVRPRITSGEIGNGYLGSGSLVSIVRGNTTVGVSPFSVWTDNVKNPPASLIPDDMFYRLALHTGPGEKEYLGGVMNGETQTASWDSASIPDGTYAIDVEFISGSREPLADLARYQRVPLIIVVDNVEGPVTGEQWLPTTGFLGKRSRFWNARGIDWIRYDGSGNTLTNATDPYPHVSVSPPATDAEREALAVENKWFTETWTKAQGDRYVIEPQLCRLKQQHMAVCGVLYSPGGVLYGNENFSDGPRNQGAVRAAAILRANLAGPGFVGASVENRVFLVHPTDGVTTLAGWVTRRDVVPYAPTHPNTSAARIPVQQFQEQKELIGSFENDVTFKFVQSSIDLSEVVQDPQNPALIYVADSGNHRVALIDTSQSPARITTFAGKPNTSGFDDGDRLTARFSSPRGLEIVDRTLYVGDLGNSAIRAINLDIGVVTTPAGKVRGAVIHDALDRVSSLRRDSRGNLVFRQGKGQMYRLDVQALAISFIGNGPHGDSGCFDVDWRGNIGPVDDIIFCGMDNHDSGRLSADGSSRTKLLAFDVGFPCYTEACGAVPQSFAIDDEEAQFASTHLFRSEVAVHRPLQPSDPIDVRLLVKPGVKVMEFGTIDEFYPTLTRSDLFNIHGETGFHRLGSNVPVFDELAHRTDAELAEYIQNGMGGTIPRPEITGRHLQGLIYYIRATSLQGKTEPVDADQIARNLQVAGYWNDLNDTRVPGIQGITVEKLNDTTRRISWQTDEPTFGMVSYGRRMGQLTGDRDTAPNLGVIVLEEATEHVQTHAIILSDLPTDADDQNFFIRSKDQAGNMAESAVHSLTGQVVPPDTVPPVLSNIQISDITANTSKISWNTDEFASARIDYGLNTSYGQAKTLPSFTAAGNLTLTNLQPGTQYHFKITATDPSGNSVSSQDQTFTTEPEPAPNTAPTLSIGNGETSFSVEIGQLLSIPITATDADGDPITISIPNLETLLPGATIE